MPEIQHTLVTGSCEALKIADLCETADNEYYMSALKTSDAHRDRALRGRDRIEKVIEELALLRAHLSCAACFQEIDRQTELQRQSIREIDHAWLG